jgi:hypothetical protein
MLGQTIAAMMQANAPAPEEKGVNIAKFALRKFRIDRGSNGSKH